MRLRMDNEFQQVKIKDLNQQNNFEMFITQLSGVEKHSLQNKN